LQSNNLKIIPWEEVIIVLNAEKLQMVHLVNFVSRAEQKD